jgi:colanic acid/amylovoran biosynthesis glycosyltransferase
MNVLHFRTVFLPLSETFVYSQIKYATRFKPKVFCFTRENAEVFPVSNIFVLGGLSRIDLFKYNWISALPPIMKVIWKRTPSLYEKFAFKLQPFDVIHAHFGYDGVIAIRLKKVMRKPLIVSIYGIDATGLLHRKPDYYKYIFDEFDAVITVSNFLKERLLAHGYFNKIYVNRLGVDVNSINFTPPKPWNNRRIRLLNVGRYVEKKGQKYLIKAVKILLKRGYKIEAEL